MDGEWECGFHEIHYQLTFHNLVDDELSKTHLPNTNFQRTFNLYRNASQHSEEKKEQAEEHISLAVYVMRALLYSMANQKWIFQKIPFYFSWGMLRYHLVNTIRPL